MLARKTTPSVAPSTMSKKRKSGLVVIGSLGPETSPKKAKPSGGLLDDPNVLVRVRTSAKRAPAEDLPFNMNALFLGGGVASQTAGRSTVPVPAPSEPAQPLLEPEEPSSDEEGYLLGNEVCNLAWLRGWR